MSNPSPFRQLSLCLLALVALPLTVTLNTVDDGTGSFKRNTG